MVPGAKITAGIVTIVQHSRPEQSLMGLSWRQTRNDIVGSRAIWPAWSTNSVERAGRMKRRNPETSLHTFHLVVLNLVEEYSELPYVPCLGHRHDMFPGKDLTQQDKRVRGIFVAPPAPFFVTPWLLHQAPATPSGGPFCLDISPLHDRCLANPRRPASPIPKSLALDAQLSGT